MLSAVRFNKANRDVPVGRWVMNIRTLYLEAILRQFNTSRYPYLYSPCAANSQVQASWGLNVK